MPKLRICTLTNMSSDISVSGLKTLKPPSGWKFEVDAEFDSKVMKLVEDDSVLQAEMHAAAKKVYKQTCESIKSKYVYFEKFFNGVLDHGKPEQINGILENLKGFNKSLEDDKKIGEIGAAKAVEAVWKTWQSKNKEYKKYGIKIFVTVFGAAAGLGVSIGLMATSPFHGGMGAVAGILGMWKSVQTIAKECYSAYIEVETAQKNLTKYMKAVEAIAKKGKAAAKGNEYAAAFVKQFLGECQPNIKGCGAQLEIIEKKLFGVSVKLHNCVKTLNDIVSKQEGIKTDFMKEAKARLGKIPGKQAPQQLTEIEARLLRQLKDNELNVDHTIKKVDALLERIKTARKKTEELALRVKPLMALRGLDNVILENILYFADMPLGGLDGNHMVTASHDLVTGLVPVAASMAYDKFSGGVLDKTLLA